MKITGTEGVRNCVKYRKGVEENGICRRLSKKVYI
jgi:hypothetical protein